MNKTRILIAALCGALAVGAAGVAGAGNGTPINAGSADTLTLAVYGDWPYSLDLLAKASLLIDSINSDPKVRLVLHIGDIHSGSMPCTGVGLNPIPAGSVPGWNQGIFDLFEQFKDPVVYTPGDNEWTDCHKKKELFSGYPLYELASVRELFFPDPGYTLGGRKKQVSSQSEAFDPAYPADAQFVENVMWEESQVVFATLNMPGSNNDTLPWTCPLCNPAAQSQEASERTAADIRWLEAAFARAEADDAKAVLIGLQADMWDPAQILPGGDGLDHYTTFVHRLADLAVHFGRPVLLIHGDSHVYGAEHPLANPASATGLIHATQAVPNLTRLTVEGSTAADEWIKLTIDPRSADIFSWERIQYLP